jgi:hypothetical protein
MLAETFDKLQPLTNSVVLGDFHYTYTPPSPVSNAPTSIFPYIITLLARSR